LRIPVAIPPETAMLGPSVRLLGTFRHGESSGELGSVMILEQMVGNSLGKKSESDRKTSHEY
jgi:hypothetical protein